jgi:alpha-tubulin suppressor-like RCC1 family protein
LGDNSTTQRLTPVQVKDNTGTGFLTGVVSVAAGTNHSLALASDNTVWAWGSNTYGQLGDNSSTQKIIPVQVKDHAGTGNLTGIIAIAAGQYLSLALKSDGTVWTWGSGDFALGNNTQGNNAYTPVQVKDYLGTGVLTGITAIATSGVGSLALASDNTVWAWGYNYYGELGDNTTTHRLIPVHVKDASGTDNLTGITAISMTIHSLAVKSDGTVWAWGSNSYGQLGDNTTSERHLPVQLKDNTGTGFLTGAVSVAAGSLHSYALKSDGTVWAWGLNFYGELGNNSTTNSLIPVQVSGLTGAVSVAAGAYHGLAIASSVLTVTTASLPAGDGWRCLLSNAGGIRGSNTLH